jgi:predicted PurR-regulated permease PerM
VVEAAQAAAAKFKAGVAIIPPPPDSIGTWPIIGAPLKGLWTLASKDLTEAIRRFGPQIKAALPGVLSASAGFGLTMVQLLLSIIVSGVLLANAKAAHEVVRALANRIFGEKGPEFQQLVGKTIRSITFGILGVALIQSFLAAVGFFVVGIPAASLWSVIFLLGAVVQAGGLVLIPALIYIFATAGTTTAVIFLIWCIFVGLLDNILKPMLLGRGVAVPMAVIFLGAFGGMFAMGIIGLFIGAVVLSVGYKLFLAWLQEDDAADQGAA